MEAVRNGDTTAVRAFLAQTSLRKTMAFNAAYVACRRNDDESLTLLLPYVETKQTFFGILLSECVHADHVACTEVLLQHWKSVCNNVTFVPQEWEFPAVCRVLIDAGADIHTGDEDGYLPLHTACVLGALEQRGVCPAPVVRPCSVSRLD